MKIRLKIKFVSGLKTDPKCLDFYIIPSIAIARELIEDEGGGAFGLFLCWGYWAIGPALYYVK